MGRSAYGLEVDRDQHWVLRAACRGHDPTWWEIASTSNRAKRDRNDAACAICRRCPVKTECQERADRLGAHGMIIAGTAWKQTQPAHGYLRSPTISLQCARDACRAVFVTTNHRQRYCTRRCQMAERNRESARRRRDRSTESFESRTPPAYGLPNPAARR